MLGGIRVYPETRVQRRCPNLVGGKMYRQAVLIGLYDGVFGEDARGGAIFVTGAGCFGLIGNR